MKRILITSIVLALSLFLMACSSNATSTTSGAPASVSSEQSETGSSSAPAEPLNLEGEWKQVNKPLAFGPHKAVIEGDTITIYWIDEEADSESLYWAGTYTAPTEPGDTWEWVSENDHEQTDRSLYAANNDTKDFKYENGQILYQASAMGTNQTVHMERA